MRCLGDLPLRALEAAVLMHVSTNRWFPTIAELREAALSVREGGIPTAVEAWAEVMKAFEFVGYYGIPQWSHPAITKTVDAMGWQNLCLSENAMADRAHFMRLYETYAKRLRDEGVMLPDVKAIGAEGGPARIAEAINALADAKRCGANAVAGCREEIARAVARLNRPEPEPEGADGN